MRRRALADVTAGVLVVAATIAVSVAAASGGWPGRASGCIAAGDCGCEAFRSGLLEQPVNAFSAAGFVVVGLAVLATITRPGPRRNRFSTESVYARLFAFVVLSLGAGSAWFHGSVTEWGGWTDLTAVHLFVSYLFWYDVAVLARRSTRWFLGAFASTNLALAGAMWFLDNGFARYTMATLIAGVLLTEARLWGRIVRRRRWLVAALVVYGAGTVAWLLSGDGGPWCRPDGSLQGHALWHVLAAAGVALVYLYLRSEEDTALTPRGRPPAAARSGPRPR
jgi:hypothetical protein